MRAPETAAALAAAVAGFLLLAAVPLPSPAFAQDRDAAKRLEGVRKELEQSQERQRALEGEATRLGGELAAVRQRQVVTAARLQEQEEEVTRLERRLDVLAAEEGLKSAALAARRDELSLTLASLVRIARRPPVAMLLAPGEALDIVRASQLVAATVPEIDGRARALGEELAALAVLRRAIAAEQIALGRAIDRLERDRAELEGLQAEMQQAQRDALAAGREETRRAARLAEVARDLEALVSRLAEAGRREAESRAAPQVARLPDSRPPAAGAGRVQPVRGRLVGRFGEAGENGATLKGVKIETRAEAQVVAPADGKVVFAGPFRGYGLLLIIAHSGGYHSLLAGFARIDSVVGQWLLAGEPVGLMGGDAAAKPTLYVEVRLKGEPVNPTPWLAAGERKVSG